MKKVIALSVALMMMAGFVFAYDYPIASGIISPEDGEEVYSDELLELKARDFGAVGGGVQWAVRYQSCSVGTNTVAGNVDGKSDDFNWIDGVFTSEINIFDWDLGEYCFVFNPRNGDRYTRWFEIVKSEVIDIESPIVTIESPKNGDTVHGMVDIYGTVFEETELSHYNISIYPGDANFNDFSKRLYSKTVYLSEGFDNQILYSWDTTEYDDGDYLIRLAARDKAGNRDLSCDAYAGGVCSHHVVEVTVKNNDASEKDQCMNDGWKDFGFRNQGQCIRFINTGQDSR